MSERPWSRTDAQTWPPVNWREGVAERHSTTACSRLIDYPPRLRVRWGESSRRLDRPRKDSGKIRHRAQACFGGNPTFLHRTSWMRPCKSRSRDAFPWPESCFFPSAAARQSVSAASSSTCFIERCAKDSSAADASCGVTNRPPYGGNCRSADASPPGLRRPTIRKAPSPPFRFTQHCAARSVCWSCLTGPCAPLEVML